jgi:PIN domain nuclease of toxin-antitoxin system
MKIIIDTHIFLWVLSDPKRIDKGKRVEIETLSNIVYVSSISIAEIMIKASIGKLICNFDPVEMAKKSGFEILDFNGEDALLLKDMPFYHKDPFDRMLIAQSIANDYPIVTNDKKFQQYDCRLI